MHEYEYKDCGQEEAIASGAVRMWRQLSSKNYVRVEKLKADQWYVIGWLPGSHPREIDTPREGEGEGKLIK